MLKSVKGNHIEDCSMLVVCDSYTWADRKDTMTSVLEARGKRFVESVIGEARCDGFRWWQSGELYRLVDPPSGGGLWVGEGRMRFTPRKTTVETWAWRRPTLADGWEVLACLTEEKA